MNTTYFKTDFTLSAPAIRHLPEDTNYEIAFAGRSNAGKSSALNVITNQSNLARTSKTPGRTQAINLFEVPGYEPPRYLVDLPGYGFANVPLKIKQQWEQELGHYLMERDSLSGVIMIIDVRRLLSDFDLQMLECCQHRNLPAHILLTKADKLKRGAASNALL